MRETQVRDVSPRQSDLTAMRSVESMVAARSADRVRRLTHVMAVPAVLLLAVASPWTARAAERGSLPPAYAPGGTIGIPKGALPPPGVYWQETSAFAHLTGVNGNGARTGARTNAYFTIGNFVWATDWRFLGGRYGAYIANAGVYHVSLNLPNGRRSDTTSLGDVEVDPIEISWKVAKHLFVSASEGVNLPIGSYSKDRFVNVGHNRFTFEQHISASYFSKHYIATLNGTISVNSPNRSNGYVSGSAYDLDFSAERKLGAFSTGPVGYYFKQFGSDAGKKSLDSGMPVELGLGWLVGYKFDKWRFSLYITRDVYSRSFAKQTKVWFTVSHRLF